MEALYEQSVDSLDVVSLEEEMDPFARVSWPISTKVKSISFQLRASTLSFCFENDNGRLSRKKAPMIPSIV